MPSKNDALKELAKRNPYTEMLDLLGKIHSTQKVLVNAGLQPI